MTIQEAQIVKLSL